MRSMFSLAVSTLLLMQPAHAQKDACADYEAINDARRIFAGVARDCIVNNAQRMSRGPDSASDVAIAALQTCHAKVEMINDECIGSANVTGRYVEEFRREAIRVAVQARSGANRP